MRTYSELERTLQHFPPDRADWHPGGMARTAVEVVAHCGVHCRFFAAIMAGNPLPYRTADEMESALDQYRSLPDALAFLRDAVADLARCISEMADEKIATTMVMPWGERVPVAFGLLMPAMHLQYHLGQVCQLQTMLGDDTQY